MYFLPSPRGSQFLQLSGLLLPCMVVLCLVSSMELAAQIRLLRDADVRAALEAADARDAVRLLAFLGRNPDLDARILTALGSVQADTALLPVMKALDSEKPAVRRAAAFAAGQILRTTGSTAPADALLLSAFKRERDANVVRAICDAIGGAASPGMLDSVAEHTPLTASDAAAQAACIARFAMRGIRTHPGSLALGRSARTYSEHPDVLADVMYAFMRIADSAMLAPHTGVILDACASSSADVRMHAVAAAGRSRQRIFLDTLLHAARDADWRVRANTARALASLAPNPEARKACLRAAMLMLRDPNVQVAKAAMQALTLMPVSDQRAMLAVKKMIDTCSSADARDEAYRTLAALAPEFTLELLFGVARNSTVHTAALQAAGIAVGRGATGFTSILPWLRTNVFSADAQGSSAAIASWAACWRSERKRSAMADSCDAEFGGTLLDALRAHSDSFQNAGAVQAIAEALADSVVMRASHARALRAALPHFSSRDNVETVVTLVETIGRIGDSAAVASLASWCADSNAAVRATARRALSRHGVSQSGFSAPGPALQQPRGGWKQLLDFRGWPVARIRTRHGEILARLDPEAAPYTVAAFIGLVRTGFYNGLTFHRVVPNFVVQGGDPRGDGTGGPPFTLRSEFSPQSFYRGALGIASAGKDTEGSQFFIMHSSAPHLDGRYTLFGWVFEGMEAVDRLEVGDRILSIHIDDVQN